MFSKCVETARPRLPTAISVARIVSAQALLLRRLHDVSAKT